MKKKYLVSFQGKSNNWSMLATMTKREAEYMRADGIVVLELLYVWPDWVEAWGLENMWMFASDVFNFRNPFRSRKKDAQ